VELLDRDRELNALASLLDRTRRGEGGALVLRGDPGVGLTALLEHTADEAAEMHVLRVSGLEAERAVSFGALHRLLGPLMPRRNGVPVAQRAALEHAFGLSVGDGGQPNLLIVGLGTLNLLTHLAGQRPVLCLVDDAEELDERSAVALAIAARRLSMDAVAMVIAWSETGDVRDHFTGLRRLNVRGLPDAAARTLLESVVGPRLDVRARERVIAEVAGNPRAILELPRDLDVDTSAYSQPLPVGKRLQHHYIRRLRSLSSSARELLLLAAASSEQGHAHFWPALADLKPPDAALREAVDGGFITLSPRVSLTHKLARSAIFADASPEGRMRVHEALARAARAASDGPGAAWHQAAAAPTPDEAIAVALAVAAEQARDEGRTVDAAALMERSAAMTPDVDLRAPRLLEAAAQRLAAGSPGRASALVAETVVLPLSELDRARAVKLRAQIAASVGQSGDSATLLLRAAQRIAPLDERLGRESLLEALEMAILSGRFGSGGQVLEAARAALPVVASATDDPAELLLQGLALLFAGAREEGTRSLRRAIGRVGGNPRWQVLAGLSALEVWDQDVLGALVASADAVIEEAPLAPASLALGYLAGLDEALSGRFLRAEQRFAATTALGNAVGEPSISLLGVAASLLVWGWCGPADEGRRHIERGARTALSNEMGRYHAFARASLAVLENGAGRYDAALGAAQEVVEDNGLYLATFALPELAEAAVRVGETEIAVAAAERLRSRVAAPATDWGAGMLARTQALVAPAGDAEALYVEAIARLSKTRALPQQARARLLYGEWLRRRRRRRDAREQLRRAHGMFAAMGANIYADRAEGELRATGEHITRRVPGPVEALTAQESRIANLVAHGASHPEVAARLYISARTVEYHLRKVFRKLGVSSRVELARIMVDGRESV
jgi:DNA-binding CsgD family transcriptional regulator